MSNMYDHEIDGVGWFRAASNDVPETRKTADWRTQQIDTSAAPGEQALNGDWRKSQDSYHLGTGILYTDSATDRQIAERFRDSCGVNPWTPGQVSLLRATAKVWPNSGSASGRVYSVGYSAGGSDGVLVAAGSSLTRVNAVDADDSIAWGGSGVIQDLTSNGGSWFVLAPGGIYRGKFPNGNGTMIYDLAGSEGAGGKIAHVKDRLVVCIDDRVHIVADSGNGGNIPAAKFDLHESGWTWSDIAEGPTGIYLSGYAGDRSRIYSSKLGGDEAAPELQVPTVVAELGLGEAVLCMYSYGGSLLFLGTSKGFRVAQMQANGTLTMGPLTETDAPVYSASGYGDYVWCGGANVGGHPGLYRVSLRDVLDGGKDSYSQFGTLRFPYAKDIAYTGAPFRFTDEMRGVAPIGQSGRMSFTVDGTGMVFENKTTLVSSGWIETGRIRYNTSEKKMYSRGRVLTSATPGTLKIEWRGEGGVLHTAVDTFDTTDITETNFEIDPIKPHPFITLRFTLGRDADTNGTPVLAEWTTKALPSGVVQRSIVLPLLCMPSEEPAGGYPVNRPVWERVFALEAAEEAKRVVTYRNVGSGELRYVVVDQVQHIITTIPEDPAASQEPGGIVIVTLRTV